MNKKHKTKALISCQKVYTMKFGTDTTKFTVDNTNKPMIEIDIKPYHNGLRFYEEELKALLKVIKGAK